jgi:GT2 family glycosyltransferase
MESLSENRVSVVIINWNGENLLKKYFHSLINQDFKNLEIIFVDNNSIDKSIRIVEKINKNKFTIKIIRNDRNYGTAKASNIGAKYCNGKYIFFVSNDMLFEKNLITNLYNFLEKNSQIGVATTKMLKEIKNKKTDIIDSCGGNIDFLCTAQSNNINIRQKKLYDKNNEIFFSFGGALFIRKKIFNKVRGYDERYFTLTDDVDLCWRIKLIGYKIFYITGSQLYHRVSSTLSKTHNRATKRYFSERNSLCTCLKNYNLLTLSLILPIYFIISILEIIFFLVIFKPKMSYAMVRSITWNIANIRETLKKRRYIQQIRNSSDIQILNKVIKYPVKLYYFYSFIFERKKWSNYF